MCVSRWSGWCGITTPTELKFSNTLCSFRVLNPHQFAIISYHWLSIVTRSLNIIKQAHFRPGRAPVCYLGFLQQKNSNRCNPRSSLTTEGRLRIGFSLGATHTIQLYLKAMWCRRLVSLLQHATKNWHAADDEGRFCNTVMAKNEQAMAVQQPDRCSPSGKQTAFP